MNLSSSVLAIAALLAVAGLSVPGVHADQTPTDTSQPAFDEKASWAPIRALAAMDNTLTSQPATHEKTWTPAIRALRVDTDNDPASYDIHTAQPALHESMPTPGPMIRALKAKDSPKQEPPPQQQQHPHDYKHGKPTLPKNGQKHN